MNYYKVRFMEKKYEYYKWYLDKQPLDSLEYEVLETENELIDEIKRTGILRCNADSRLTEEPPDYEN